jgi:hypothetical protein
LEVKSKTFIGWLATARSVAQRVFKPALSKIRARSDDALTNNPRTTNPPQTALPIFDRNREKPVMLRHTQRLPKMRSHVRFRSEVAWRPSGSL